MVIKPHGKYRITIDISLIKPRTHGLRKDTKPYPFPKCSVGTITEDTSDQRKCVRRKEREREGRERERHKGAGKKSAAAGGGDRG